MLLATEEGDKARDDFKRQTDWIEVTHAFWTR
jgi:hypothetical protein